MINSETIDQLKELDDDGSNETLKELINLYLESTPPKLARMQEFLDARNWDGLRKEAHSLRSSSLNLGAERLGELGSLIEYKKESADFEKEMSAHMSEVSIEFKVVRAELEKLLQ